MSSFHDLVFSQRWPDVRKCWQDDGSVSLNCCSTGGESMLHSPHTKRPYSSSGRTSVVRVMVPQKLERRPMSGMCRSRTLRTLPVL